jgi:HEPN domain-containing protein
MLNNYYDFAENDYQYLLQSFEAGMVANAMGALAQGICEKYLKYIINEYVVPQSSEESTEKGRILRTHNLNKLYKYLLQYLPEMEISKRTLNAVNGLCFTTLYPGDESIVVDEEDIREYVQAVQECKLAVDKYIDLQRGKEEDMHPINVQDIVKIHKTKIY